MRANLKSKIAVAAVFALITAEAAEGAVVGGVQIAVLLGGAVFLPFVESDNADIEEKCEELKANYKSEKKWSAARAFRKVIFNVYVDSNVGLNGEGCTMN